MRITVGHVLILSGVGCYVALGPLKVWNAEALWKELASLGTSAVSLVEFFKSGAQTGSTGPSYSSSLKVVEPAAPKVEDKLPPLESASEPATEPASALSLQSVETPAAPPKVQRRKGKKRTVRKQASSKSVQKPKAGAATTGKDPLIGTYVALTLKSGREVKGILEERTPTMYKIQLPGMGPFSYSADTVVRIQQAQ